MSSSPRNGQRTERKRPSGKAVVNEAHWWDDLPEVMACLQCGEKAMRRTVGPCRLLDGTFMPVLERFQCSSCQANFFDDAAMRAIDAVRKTSSLKTGKSTRLKRMKAAA